MIEILMGPFNKNNVAYDKHAYHEMYVSKYYTYYHYNCTYYLKYLTRKLEGGGYGNVVGTKQITF